jgi:predicted PolB exonuclease-like 3'-5' exonuclease
MPVIREVCFDLETIRDPRAKPFIPEKGPRDRTDPAEKVNFDPNYIMPCVAGFYDGKNSWSVGLDNFGGENIEAKLLRAIWEYLEAADTIITFNGHSFDIPLLMRRSWYNGVPPKKLMDLRKYHTGAHVDVRMVITNWDSYARGTLDLYAQLKLGTGKTDDMDGSQVQGLWDKSEYEKIHAYCKNDCKITWDLFQSLKGWYL